MFEAESALGVDGAASASDVLCVSDVPCVFGAGAASASLMYRWDLVSLGAWATCLKLAFLWLFSCVSLGGGGQTYQQNLARS